MDLSRRLRPHGSRPACLRCCSLESMRELALDHDALIRRGVPVPALESIPAGNFCRISEAPVFGFPHTANISSPGCLGSTGFHGMASLVVKLSWVAPAFALAGVASVPRCCAEDCVVIVIASATTTLVNVNTLLFTIGSLLFRISRITAQRWKSNARAKSELLPVLRYSSGHRKGRLRILYLPKHTKIQS